ncbi:MAG: S9 family peptidase [Planctomycetaceae bacterium]|nr:S9 family peptidase [Planctomycetaceae bacterium]
MRRVCALLLFVVQATCGFADAQERTHDITPDDYASVNTITEIAVSPDGKQVAYCLATWDKKADNRRTDLWVVDTDGKGKPKQLTKDRANERHPKWSADGRSIYVLANRTKQGEKAPLNGKTQVWKVPAEGGEPVAVTKIGTGVIGYDYAPKADAVFYSIDATTTDEDDFTALRKKFPNPEYGFGKRTVSEVFRLDAKDEKAKPEQVIADKRYIREFAVTQDGKRIAMVSAIDDTVLKSEGESRVDVWEGGKIVTPPTEVYREKAASPHAWLENLVWSPDGTRFAFCAVFDAYPTEIIIGVLKDGIYMVTQANRAGKLAKPWQVIGYGRGTGCPLVFSFDHELKGICEQAGTTGVFHYSPRDGETAVFFADRWHPIGLNQDTYHGIPVWIEASTGHFPVIATVSKEKKGIFSLVDPNPHTATWKFPSVQHVTWKAPDGTTVGGPLELPHGWKKGDKPLPLVVAIHGGPTTASYNDLRFDPHNGRLYFAAKGYAVLCPNYRGSTGYGDKHVTDLIGKENDIEVKDILAGIQHLIKEGIADPDRIAVMGWSNGGYLTNCLITLKDSPVKIRAASSGAGIVDTVSEWGFNDEPAYPKVFKKGLPWEQPDIYKATSPTYGLGNVKTPTLIHVGGGDERCPPGHSRMLHRALKEYVKVPTELMVYPGEPHGLTKLSNRVAKMEWDLAWFEKYLKK